MNASTPGFGLIQDIDVRLTVELGRTDMALRDVLALGEESVVMLDRLTDEPLDVKVNGKLIARGEVVAEGNRFGLRIIEMVGADPQSAPRAAEPANDAVLAEAQAWSSVELVPVSPPCSSVSRVSNQGTRDSLPSLIWGGKSSGRSSEPMVKLTRSPVRSS